MRRDDIRFSLDKIQPPPGVKERVYKNIMENSQNEKYVSKKKLHFVKLRVDRVVPYAAAFIILFCCFAIYGVNTGLFTGAPIKDAAAPSAASNQDTAGGAQVQNEEGSPEFAEVPPKVEEKAEAAKFSGNAAADLAAPPVTVTALLPFDVGYTSYTVENVPQDALALWDELVRIKAINGLNLESYSFEDNILTLNFDKSLQNRLDAGATNVIAIGLSKTFSSLYPDAAEIIINSSGSPIEFGGEKLNCTSLKEENVSVTDSKTFTYGEDK